ncbi:hypothetical protein PAE9249_00449 [Paenibacillus sp. CECT 9249]|nr:hypothetical protein PAE9249_00449 [Paenibacillus sp. CECT 9249]
MHYPLRWIVLLAAPWRQASAACRGGGGACAFVTLPCGGAAAALPIGDALRSPICRLLAGGHCARVTPLRLRCYCIAYVADALRSHPICRLLAGHAHPACAFSPVRNGQRDAHYALRGSPQHTVMFCTASAGRPHTRYAGQLDDLLPCLLVNSMYTILKQVGANRNVWESVAVRRLEKVIFQRMNAIRFVGGM